MNKQKSKKIIIYATGRVVKDLVKEYACCKKTQRMIVVK